MATRKKVKPEAAPVQETGSEVSFQDVQENLSKLLSSVEVIRGLVDKIGLSSYGLYDKLAIAYGVENRHPFLMPKSTFETCQNALFYIEQCERIIVENS